jgi:hypothetical protein
MRQLPDVTLPIVFNVDEGGIRFHERIGHAELDDGHKVEIGLGLSGAVIVTVCRDGKLTNYVATPSALGTAVIAEHLRSKA